MYDFLKTIHVLAAAAWVGSALLVQIQAARMRTSGDQTRMVAFLDEQEWLGKRFFAPVAGIAAVFGILLVVQGPWRFEEAWIAIGIALFIVSSVVGARFLTPESERLRDLVSQRGLGDPDVRRRIDRIALVARIDTTVLALIVVDMVVKPGT